MKIVPAMMVLMKMMVINADDGDNDNYDIYIYIRMYVCKYV
jgi:hypothetical protein